MQKKVIKTNLGLLNDIENEIQSAFNLYDVQSELITAQMQVKKAKSKYVDVLTKAEDGLKKAKDLGAQSLSDPFSKRVSEIKGAIGMCDKLIVAIDKAISAV
jgi:hypothetical protein